MGALDYAVLELNRHAHALLHCQKRLAVVPGATHLFEEPGTLATAADLAQQWLHTHLAGVSRTPGRALSRSSSHLGSSQCE